MTTLVFRFSFNAKWLMHSPNLLLQNFDISVNGNSIFPLVQAKNFGVILTLRFLSYPRSSVLVIMLIPPSEYTPDFDCFPPLQNHPSWLLIISCLHDYRSLPPTPLLLWLVPALYSQPSNQSDVFETKSEPHAST